ncbi:hypothetical protein [Sphingobacterium sp. UBA6645]|uniref:hypothetical protein n=1 Tax=Sphingobacterium sp. UBA6645 TaxID=1947511 RepID=UPI0025F2D7DF|nr:hypothetical protein [Sphingobacterium sp. UBA6645]
MKTSKTIFTAILVCFFAFANAQESELIFDYHLRIYNGVNKVFKKRAVFTWDGKNNATMSHDGELLFKLTLRNRRLEQDHEGRYLVYDAYEAIDDEDWRVIMYESGKIQLWYSANLMFIYNDAEYEKLHKYYK